MAYIADPRPRTNRDLEIDWEVWLQKETEEHASMSVSDDEED